MIDQEDEKKAKVFLTTTIKQLKFRFVWDNPVPDFWLSSSQLFVILLIIFGCFWKIHLSKTGEESTVDIGRLCSAAGYLLPSLRLRRNKLVEEGCGCVSLVGLSETEMSQPI